MKRSGFLLFETMAALALLLSAAYVTIPYIWDWQEERKLELATAEVVAAIRRVQTDVKNEDEKYGHMASGRTFYCQREGDRGTYHTKKGIRLIRPKGVLPKGIIVDGEAARISFYKGVTVDGDYNIFLATKDKKHRTQIIVAMYTGRVRSVRLR